MVVNENDLDSREIKDLIRVRAHIYIYIYIYTYMHIHIQNTMMYSDLLRVSKLI